IQQDLKITTIFVTHDQEEAMSMADRVAVMKDGEILQVGTPTDLYSNPKTPFIADFVGISNIMLGVIEKREGDTAYVKIGNQVIKSKTTIKNNEVKAIVRPENINILDKDSKEYDNYFEGTIELATYLGST